MAYLLLSISIICEVGADTCMKLSQGFKRKRWLIGVVVGYVISLYMMGHVLAQLSLGYAYALWISIAIALTAIVGHIIWKEGFNTKKVVGIILIIAGVALMRLGV
jgi:multidrug transporter EmrE-like cation transporter